MSFRTKVLLSITGTVVVAVWLVAWIVSTLVTQSFERQDTERTENLVARFHGEFGRRGADVARRIEAVVNSDAVEQMVVNLSSQGFDTSPYFDQAQTLAQEQSLDFLEIVGPDGRIISSAEWPARFGYQESWLSLAADWKAEGVFLKRIELPQGSALGYITVRTVKVGTGTLYVAGGQRLDPDFLASLPTPDGMHVRLFPNLEGAPLPANLGSAQAAALVRDVRREPRELTHIDSALALTAIPLFGRDAHLLAILLVETSRAQLASLTSYIRVTAAAVGAGGVLLGLLLSFWTSSRVTRPLRELTVSVREVAGGRWDTRASFESSDEVGQLARDFNHMTEQLREQRDRMIQAERVAAWRELARRLAHELKNPLFPLQITVENMQRAKQSSPDQFEEVFRESTSTLLSELGNLKTIIGRFSDFAKMPAPELEPIDLNDIIRDVVQLFDAQMNAPGHPPIEARLSLNAGLAAVAADPEQIRRALHNLILNALDAMPQGGTLTISTDGADRKVSIEVSDTGEGLTAEECERLFTPYYTTKQHGTGLGLAIVQSVVSDHKGTITVQSQPGKGTTFRIELNA